MPKPADYPAPASPPGPPGEAKPILDREMQVQLQIQRYRVTGYRSTVYYIQVEEKLVGAVLGPSGRHVVEIQQYSGATIQVLGSTVY